MDCPAEEGTREELDRKAEPANPGSNDVAAVDAVEPGVQAATSTAADRLQELLRDEPDLKLWLEHTRFFDLGHRERVLDSIRRLQAVEEEREKLMAELRGSAGGLFHGPSTSAVIDASPALAHRPSQVASHFVSTPTSTAGSFHAGSSARGEERPVAPLPVALPATPPIMDSRFFLVKCFNTANIYMSQRDGLWVTQAKNGPILTEAFKECQSVILFFSINKSRGFQGFARMASAPDPSLPKPDWIQRTNLSAMTPPFRVEWINTADTDFDEVGDLQNPMNEFRSVVVGRDGQEYPPECGRKMMALMNQTAQKTAAGLTTARTRFRGVDDVPCLHNNNNQVWDPIEPRIPVVYTVPRPEPRSPRDVFNLIDY